MNKNQEKDSSSKESGKVKDAANKAGNNQSKDNKGNTEQSGGKKDAVLADINSQSKKASK